MADEWKIGQEKDELMGRGMRSETEERYRVNRMYKWKRGHIKPH